MAPKKRKISGLSGVELSLAYTALLNLKKTIVYEPDDESAAEAKAATTEKGEFFDEAKAQAATIEKGEMFDEHLEGMIRLIESRLNGPQSLTFSGMNISILHEQMHIDFGGFLDLKPKKELEGHISSTISLGENELWSSDTMYRHLTTLEMVVPRTTEASARAWIDTFFFRASAMVPVDQRMVLNMEYIVPSTRLQPDVFTTISGRTDYTAIIAESKRAAALLTSTHHILNIGIYEPSGFFVVEGKLGELADHVPQAVSEIYACAKNLTKNIARGALTNGREWIFLIVFLKEGGKGAMFKRSYPIQYSVTFDVLSGPSNLSPTIVKPGPDFIAGVLSYWIQHSFEDITTTDWFKVGP